MSDNDEKMIGEPLVEKIEAGLVKYYERLEAKYPPQQDGNTLTFTEWAHENGASEDDYIRDELNEGGDCYFIEFDKKFPLDEVIEDKEIRNTRIAKIFKTICIYGSYEGKIFVKRLHVDICSNMEHKFILKAVERYKKQMSVLSFHANQDEALKYYLGINEREGFPFLMYIVDGFTRDRAQKYADTRGKEEITIAKWAQKNKFMQALKKSHPQRYESLQAAMGNYSARFMHRLKFKTTFVINDNLKHVAEYIVAAPKFIQKLVLKLKADKDATPFQIDLLIAVHSVISTVNDNLPVSTDKDDEDADDIKEEKELDPNKDHIGHIQEQLANVQLLYCPKKDWDIKETETKDDLKAKTNGIARVLSQRYNNFTEVLSKSQDKNYDFERYPQNRRFSIFVDRRDNKPTNKNKGNISSNKELCRDQITFFQPPDDCNKMSKDHVPEIGFEFIRKCLIPKKDGGAITAGDGICGQLLTFMFNVEQKDEIRCYIVWNGQTMRFHGDHIGQVLPSLFNREVYTNQKFMAETKLQKEMGEMFDKGIFDRSFDPFYDELTQFKA